MATKKKREDIEETDVGNPQMTSNEWLRSLTSSQRNQVYSLTSSLADQSNGITQNDFIEQYAMGKRDWKKDFDKMFGISEKK
jgi:HPt (histidine-containing phosphotransfer) domain-containing protein